MPAMLHWLGIQSLYSRPRVSDDNAHAEALFRTAKYRPTFPAKGFTLLEQAGDWAGQSATPETQGGSEASETGIP
ncbi:MAG: transposase family protein [Ketobacter sp.]|nr:transposase family protein [Ketobacter sp.]